MVENTINSGILRIKSDSDIPDFLQKFMLVFNNQIFVMQDGKTQFPIGSTIKYVKFGRGYSFHSLH